MGRRLHSFTTGHNVAHMLLPVKISHSTPSCSDSDQAVLQRSRVLRIDDSRHSNCDLCTQTVKRAAHRPERCESILLTTPAHSHMHILASFWCGCKRSLAAICRTVHMVHLRNPLLLVLDIHLSPASSKLNFASHRISPSCPQCCTAVELRLTWTT